MPGPAGAQAVGWPAFLQRPPSGGCLPQVVPAKELFLGTFSYSSHLGLALGEDALRPLERPCLQPVQASLKQTGPNSKRVPWPPASHLPGPCLAHHRLPSCAPGPALYPRLQGPHSSPRVEEWSWGAMTFSVPRTTRAFDDTFIPCLVCKCITNTWDYTGSQLISNTVKEIFF